MPDDLDTRVSKLEAALNVEARRLLDAQANLSARWRSVLAVDDLDRLEPADVFLYCPKCAEQEFGDA